MLSHLFAALTPALYTLWIIMAYVAGQEDREKTTALKGNLKSSIAILNPILNKVTRNCMLIGGVRLY